MSTESARDFNRALIEEFRANGGQVGGDLAGTTIVLVHHVGARTGVVRVVPLVGTPDRDGRVIITASNGGSATHPDWCHNLRAHPRVTVELGMRTLEMLAEELDSRARALVWPELIAGSEALREFQARVAREIPVFVLTPV